MSECALNESVKHQQLNRISYLTPPQIIHPLHRGKLVEAIDYYGFLFKLSKNQFTCQRRY